MPELIHHLTVVVDAQRVPQAALLRITDGGRKDQIQPFGVGPFDTAEEVFSALLSRVDEQLTLW